MTPLLSPAAPLPKHFRCTAIAAAAIGALAAPTAAFSQVPPGQVVGTTSADVANAGAGANLGFVGGMSQLGVGIDRDQHVHAQASHVLSESAVSALIAQGWLGGGAGGVRLDYNFIPEKDGKAAPETWVRKLFAAVDRNRDNDAKLTLGAGLDSERWFGSLNVSRGLTRRRTIGDPLVSVTVDTISGSDNGRPFLDTQTTTSTTRLFQRAYDYGMGVRAGTLLADLQLRISLGLDREWGEYSSRQNTASLGLEKFFTGSPHSVGLYLERYSRSGEFEVDHRGTRAMLTYRFSFGGSPYASAAGWREARSLQQGQLPGATAAIPVVQSAPPAVQMRKETRIVKTTASMTSDAFFELARADLTAVARQELNRIAEILKTAERAGNIHVTGHTCDLGSEAYNLQLSLRRAKSVRDYLAAAGLPADAFVVEGMGESQPKYPNTRDSRARNRRVELEFVRYADKAEEIEVPVELTAQVVATTPPVTWRQEVVEQEPVWVRRALRNTVPHKQTVDTYRGAETTRSTSTARSWINRQPLAQEDAVTVTAGVATAIQVLANDSDPDGNALTIAAVGAAAHGTVAIAGNAVLYTPLAGYAGDDGFSYTIDDGAGGRATASVAVTVLRANQAPVARDDRYVVGYAGNWPLNVLANDSDGDGDALAIVSFTQPASGVVTQSGNGLVFQSLGQFTITTFSYTVSDGHGGTATATVTLIDP